MRDRRPLGLGSVPADIAQPLVRLSAVEGMARSIMVGTVPLAALEALGSKSAVSLAFFAGSFVTLLVTVNLAQLGRFVPRRFILTGGMFCLTLAAGIFASGPAWSIPVAIAFRSSAASIFSVMLSLYVMDFVGKGQLLRLESRRVFYVASAWLIGPFLGTWLWSNIGSDVPFIASMIISSGLIAYHWFLRLDSNDVLLAPSVLVAGPLTTVPRFFRQRSLRIAYAITCGRATFWAALFVYGPIYVVEAGLPKWAAGAFLSAASGTLLLSPFVQRLADRVGVRRMIIVGFGLMAAALTSLAVLGDAAPIGIAFWLTGAVGGGIVDVLGNIPFMRLVKPRERSAMATVFATWRETSFMVTPGIAFLVLLVGPFWLLYVCLAVVMIGAAFVTTFLPARL